MPVAYEELPGSPTFDIGRRDATGHRSVIVAWNNLAALMDEIFPDPLTGYLYGAVMPGYPDLVAVRVKIKPFDDNAPRRDVESDWTQWYDLAQIDVEYGIPKDDQQQQSGASGDHTGPGGSDGSTGGQEVTFVSHKIHLGGEFITYPADSMQWEELARVPVTPSPGEPIERTEQGPLIFGELAENINAVQQTFKIKALPVPTTRRIMLDCEGERMLILGSRTNKDRTITLTVRRGQEGTTAAEHLEDAPVGMMNPNSALKAQYGVGENVNCSVAIPLLEHSIDWNYVVSPPWLAMRQCLGKVNAYWFAGIPPECALFLGAECSRDVTNKGVKCWKMGYRISEKNMNAFNPNVPFGWNHFLRATGDNAGSFQRLNRRLPVGPTGITPFTTTSGITNTSKVLTVTSTGLPFPQNGSFLVKIDSEILAVTARLNTTQWSVIRGVRNTTAAAHTGVVSMIPGGVYDPADFRSLFKFV